MVNGCEAATSLQVAGRGVRPARPWMTGPVIPTWLGGEVGCLGFGVAGWARVGEVESWVSVRDGGIGFGWA